MLCNVLCFSFQMILFVTIAAFLPVSIVMPSATVTTVRMSQQNALILEGMDCLIPFMSSLVLSIEDFIV